MVKSTNNKPKITVNVDMYWLDLVSNSAINIIKGNKIKINWMNAMLLLSIAILIHVDPE